MAGAPPAAFRDKPEHLTRVGSYRRRMPVSLARMYENALDWEHLPWLHRSSFSSIERHDAGAWGWRAHVGMQPADSGAFDMELLLDESKGLWISRVLDGMSAGSEIWTYASELGPRDIVVEVDFYYLGIDDPDVGAMLGSTMEQLYAGLYDEDEWMMVERQKALDGAGPPQQTADATLDLGPLAELLPRLPLTVQFDGRSFRLVQIGHEIVAHATTCPHWRGPLGGAAVEEGCVRCPWHGYRFDVHTGTCTNHEGYRLPRAPRVHVAADGSTVRLSWTP